jgi:hypothetical protein
LEEASSTISGAVLSAEIGAIPGRPISGTFAGTTWAATPVTVALAESRRGWTRRNAPRAFDRTYDASTAGDTALQAAAARRVAEDRFRLGQDSPSTL